MFEKMTSPIDPLPQMSRVHFFVLPPASGQCRLIHTMRKLVDVANFAANSTNHTMYA
jgi:hypothetical protein